MPVIGEGGLAGQVRERLDLPGFRMIELEGIFGALGRDFPLTRTNEMELGRIGGHGRHRTPHIPGSIAWPQG